MIVEQPGLKRTLVEIKSTERVTDEDIRALQLLGKDISNSEAFCFSLDPTAKKIGEVMCFPWRCGLMETWL